MEAASTVFLSAPTKTALTFARASQVFPPIPPSPVRSLPKADWWDQPHALIAERTTTSRNLLDWMIPQQLVELMQIVWVSVNFSESYSLFHAVSRVAPDSGAMHSWDLHLHP